nr:MAG TPA: hypothetical protein [Caudoviricetes sp.]
MENKIIAPGIIGHFAASSSCPCVLLRSPQLYEIYKGIFLTLFYIFL